MSTARSAPNADLLPGSGSPPASGRGEAPGAAVHGSPSRPQAAGGAKGAAGDVAAHDEPTLYAAEHAAAAFGIERLAPVPAAPAASGEPTPAPSASSGVVAESDAGSMGSLSEAWRIIDTDLDKISEVLPLEQRPTLYLEVGSVVTAPHRVPGAAGAGAPAADFPASPADLPTGPREPLAEPPTEPVLTPLPLLDPLESRPEARPEARPDPLGAKTTVPFLAPVQAVPSGTPLWPAWQPGYAPPASHVPTGELPIVSAEQRRSQLWANLSMGLLGGGLMLFLVVLGLRLPALRAAASGGGAPAGAPVSAAPVQPVQPAQIDPARQYLIEQAVQALSAGRTAEALDLLGRFQAGGADPAVEIMIKKLSVHGRRPPK